MDFDFIRKQPVLQDPPLRSVICQLRFPRLIGLSEADIRPVQRLLASSYMHPEIQRIDTFALGPAGPTPTGASEQLYRFLDAAREWVVSVGPGTVSLETTKYTDFTDFASRWHGVGVALFETLEISQQDRIGLRYVNELACPPEPVPDDISRLVIPELVGVVGQHDATQRLRASIQEMRFARDRGMCTFRHGFVPRSPASAVYVLDFDLYDEEPRPLDLGSQIEVLASFNHATYELLRWSIHPDHFATFNPQEVAGDD